MFGLGMGEVLVIFLVAIIFIGPKKLPELAKSLGKGIKEFQKAQSSIMDQLREGMAGIEDKPTTPSPTVAETVVTTESVVPTPQVGMAPPTDALPKNHDYGPLAGALRPADVKEKKD